MVMRNRRVRLLMLAIIITITFLLYSRSDPTTIEGARRYAQQSFGHAYDQAMEKMKGKHSGEQAAPGLEVKKDEPFRVDFDAYAKAAAANTDDTSKGSIPPPAAPVPQPPPEPKTPPPPPEVKKDDPMRVDFAAYSKAAADPEETAPVAGSKHEVIANPNPIAGHEATEPVTKPKIPADKPKVKSSEQDKKPNEAVLPIGEGRFEIDVSAAPTGQPVHWQKRAENFPLSSTKMFPHAESTPIPKIQFDFKKAGKGADAEKLAVIKAAAEHSWKGYKEKAMGHDEVKPVSGKFANPFNAWGATLVDSLDTLWLMGMIPEFEDALKWVEKIDFTTSRRSDIPLFETTIRYMGGLLGAYEISSRNYKVLLNQAAQLGEILYGAFDTPNRMPMTYYQWKPAFTSQGHRAPTRTILAELGSLSLEFTRLGQLVGESKYYDAIARITDALEEWQPNTRIPGLWPSTVDASGCKKLLDTTKTESTQAGTGSKADSGVRIPNVDPVKPSTADSAAVKPGADAPVVGKSPGISKIAGFGDPLEEGSLDSKAAKESVLQAAGISKIVKRALDTLGLTKDDPLSAELASPASASKTSKTSTEDSALSGLSKEDTRSMSVQKPILDEESCAPQGLTSTHEYGSDIFTFGAAADSTYEYLPKMHMLLGGRMTQYEKMYKKAIEAAKKHLIFRPMIPDEERAILFAGNVDTMPGSVKGEFKRDFKPVMSHLTCFVGGMFAMSGKIFNNPEDVEMGAKLTDGCIWAYNSTTTGIMPEMFGLHKCDSLTSCAWDQKAYYKSLDPYMEIRLNAGKKTKTAPIAATGRDALEKRQFGGEMQYHPEGGPETLPVDAAARLSEVPTRDMGHSGFSGAGTPQEVTINAPFDGAAPLKLPSDTKVVPDAAKIAPTVPDTKEKPVVPEPETKAASKPIVAEPDTKAASKPVVPEPDSKIASKPIVPDSAAKGSSLNDKTAPAVPDVKLNPTLGDSKSDSTPDKKIALDVPKGGLAPTSGETDNKSGGSSALKSDQETVPATVGSLHKVPAPLEASPKEPQPHEEFVKDKIKLARLPAGMTDMYDKKYLLRPEAIESVFYMWRITGNQYWRDRGWEMWQAISEHTAAPYGASAIEDVSRTKSELHDSEESFWLAETLKYFYLLFDDPDRYSLDDWVLNTEAHFLARLGA